MTDIQNATILIMATHGFEQSELEVPRDRLRSAGASVMVAAPDPGAVKGWQKKDWGRLVPVDLTLDEVNSDEFDALVLPGGQMNPDTLRLNQTAIAVIRDFLDAGKPVAAICHAPWLLIEADALQGRRATSWPSLRRDVENAGASWQDVDVVVDHGIITSRSPKDLEAFVSRIIEEIEATTPVRTAADHSAVDRSVVDDLENDETLWQS